MYKFKFKTAFIFHLHNQSVNALRGAVSHIQFSLNCIFQPRGFLHRSWLGYAQEDAVFGADVVEYCCVHFVSFRFRLGVIAFDALTLANLPAL